MSDTQKLTAFDKKMKLYTSFVAAVCGVTIAALNIAPILDDPEGTKAALRGQGYEPISVGGGVWLGGETGDLWRTKFNAHNPEGVSVEGYATSGLFKGTVLRDVHPVNEP